ncbi:MAG TPA: hypothetical protein VF388_09430 [Lacunisphaera sp.]
MNRKLFNAASSAASRRIRTLAASYRIVGRPANAGSLPMARLTPGSDLFWHPNLLDTLRAPLSRRHE